MSKEEMDVSAGALCGRRNLHRQPITADEKKRWLEALRSGEYQQGHHVLKQNDCGTLRHCCLGVACEVFGPGFEEGDLLDGGESGTVAGTGEAHGFKAVYDRWPWFDPKENTQGAVLFQAMSMNDEGRDFLEIADYLEEKLEVES